MRGWPLETLLTPQKVFLPSSKKPKTQSQFTILRKGERKNRGYRADQGSYEGSSEVKPGRASSLSRCLEGFWARGLGLALQDLRGFGKFGALGGLWFEGVT